MNETNNIENLDYLLFPELVSTYKLKIQEQTILSNLEKLSFAPCTEEEESYKCHLSDESSLLDGVEWKEWKELFNGCINNYLNEKLKLDIKFKITESWATLTEPGGYSHKHFHAHSFVSGVFYPTGGEETAIRLYKKGISDFWSIGPKEYNPLSSNYSVLPTGSGTLILFKSYLEHKIVKYNGVHNRYSIAFNLIPVGTLGRKTTRIELT